MEIMQHKSSENSHCAQIKTFSTENQAQVLCCPSKEDGMIIIDVEVAQATSSLNQFHNDANSYPGLQEQINIDTRIKTFCNLLPL